MQVRKWISAAAAVASLFAAATASASPLAVGDTVNISNQAGSVFTPTPVSGDSNGLYAGVSYILNGGAARSANAGVFVLDYQHVSPTSTSTWTQFLSFCLEPDVSLTPFADSYEVQALATAGYSNNIPSAPGYNSALIAELWGRYRGIVDTNVEAAAFQVALWELAYGNDASLNLSDGAFRLSNPTSAVGELAARWLSLLNGTGPMASGLVVLHNTGPDRQDLITQVSVPEPATLGLLGLGLLGIGLARRRRAA